MDAVNTMTPIEFKAARDAYIAGNRNPAAKRMQSDMNRDFKRTLTESITESLRKSGMSRTEARKQATVQASQLKSKLAALHEPDMVFGGWAKPNPTRMGNTNVNSAIGAGWSSRLGGIDKMVNAAIKAGSGNHLLNIKLQMTRGLGR